TITFDGFVASRRTAYRVDRSPDGTTWTTLTSSLSPSARQSYFDPDADRTYFYAIYALYNSTPSAAAYAAVRMGTDAAVMVTAQVSAQNHTVVLSWNLGDFATAGFKIYKKLRSATEWGTPVSLGATA